MVGVVCKPCVTAKMFSMSRYIHGWPNVYVLNSNIIISEVQYCHCHAGRCFKSPILA